jgi:NAD(P) transhydrogenase subunit beta
MVGIGLAILATFFTGQITGGYVLLAIGLGIGAGIGVLLALRVEMTAMPELVAILHSFVGLAAVLVGISNYCTPHALVEIVQLEAAGTSAALIEAARIEAIIHKIEIFLGVFIGGVTFTGSIVAWGKLNGRFTSKPVLLPGRHAMNAAILGACVLLGWWFLATGSFGIGLVPLVLMTLLSFLLGVHLVLAIGGADMPVVVSMLNSYSGWAAAATGFLLKNDLLIVTGALVGSSGAILSYIMCRAMNRSFLSVILGGFGTNGGAVVAAGTQPKTHTEIFADEVAQNLLQSQQVVIIPGRFTRLRAGCQAT